MKFQTLGLLLLAGLGSAVPLQAQAPLPAQPFAPTASVPTASVPTAPAPAAPAPLTVTPNYKIAAGDVLNVGVVDFPNLSMPQSAVTPDGNVSLPLIGQVLLSGQTLDQASALLATRWKKYIINPIVTVSLVQRHQQIVIFSGAVSHPGVLNYRPDLHLIEALAEAGGLVLTGSPTVGGSTTVGLQTAISDPSHVVVTHADGTRQVLDLTDPQTKAGTATDIALTPGDVIYVPQQLGKISVVGEVGRPGVIPYRENLTLLEAISDCGSFRPETADLVNAKLTHDGKDTTINLDPMMRYGDMSANIVLAPGDRVAIPELKNRTFVFGTVEHQSFYLYKPGDRILDALSGVGGPAQNADLGKINVIHTDKSHNIIQMVRVNLNDFLLRGNISGNPFINPGDSIYIPKKGYQFRLGDITGPLNAAYTADRVLNY